MSLEKLQNREMVGRCHVNPVIKDEIKAFKESYALEFQWDWGGSCDDSDASADDEDIKTSAKIIEHSMERYRAWI